MTTDLDDRHHPSGRRPMLDRSTVGGPADLGPAKTPLSDLSRERLTLFLGGAGAERRSVVVARPPRGELGQLAPSTFCPPQRGLVVADGGSSGARRW